MDKLICKHQEEPSEYAIKFMCNKKWLIVNEKECIKCQKEKEDGKKL